MDPPRHDALGMLSVGSSLPNAIRQLEDEVRASVRTLLARTRERSEADVDIAEQFAWQLALGVISGMLGVSGLSCISARRSGGPTKFRPESLPALA